MDKKTRNIIIIILLLICLPIVFNKVKSKFIAIMTEKARSAPTKVETIVAEEKEINPTTETVGRLEAKYSVNVVARIDGWLQKTYFKEGDYVKKGQVLFLIEPDEYLIAVRNAEAEYRRTQAISVNSEKNLKRAAELVKGDYVSKSYYDNALSDRDRDKANVDAARADLAKKRLDLSYTKVVSPIDGKIGRILISPGNYVTAQTGTLANIVSIDPIYAAFTFKSEDLIHYKREKRSNEFPDVTIQLRVSDGSIFPQQGKLDFLDNIIDPTLGTIGLRATFPNPKGVLIPHDFIRIIMTANNPIKVTLIPQEVVLENVSSKYVWKISDKNTAVPANIKTTSQFGKYWIVKEGIKPGDVIVSSNIQKLREGTKLEIVQPTKEEQQIIDKANVELKAGEEQPHKLTPPEVKQEVVSDKLDKLPQEEKFE